MANFFKKKSGGLVATSGIQMTDSEAALAQSDFNVEKITEIQNRFTGGMVLLYPGRIFIREGILWKVCRKGPKKRQFFLFNDILVYGSMVANRCSNQHILPLSQMSVSAECFYQPRVNADFDEDSEQMELDAGNAFQISHADKSFHVFALSKSDKANWLANLHKHINKVAESASSEKQMVTKPVWVPDSMSKQCMVCSTKFTAFIRKHHCRRCGRVVCSACSPHRMPSNMQAQKKQSTPADTKKMERVCSECFKDTSALQRGIKVQQPPPVPPAPKLVSKVISSSASPSPGPEQDEKTQGDAEDSSTDTEDSDDSEIEQHDDDDNDGLSGHSSGTVADPTDTVVNHAPTVVNPVPTVVNPAPSSGTVVDPVPSSDTATTSSDTQPTPPPRKKKLKKKLEQIVEHQLDQKKSSEANGREGEESKLNSMREEETGDTCVSQHEVTTVEGPSPPPAGQEVITAEEPEIQEKSPKKSRRKKKHNSVLGEDIASETDQTAKLDCENTEITNGDEACENESHDSEDRSERHGSQGVNSNAKKIRTRKTKFK